MFRAISVSRQIASSPSRQSLRVIKRRLATEGTESSSPSKNYFRSFILTTTLATGTFYIGSTFVSYNNKPYHDFFVGKVPLGKFLVDYGETHGWDDLTISDVASASTEAVVTAYTLVADLLSGNKKPSEVAQNAKATTLKKAEETRAATADAVKRTAAKVEPSVQQAKERVHKTASDMKHEVKQEINLAEQKAKETVEKMEGAVKAVAQKAQYEMEELIGRAEAAIAGKAFEPPSVKSDMTGRNAVEPTTARNSPSTSPDVYYIPLPLGFEPPPGYTHPQSLKPKLEDKSDQTHAQHISLPPIAPSIADSSEPIITHLAGTIDNLTSYLKVDPEAAQKAGGILENAKGDLAALVDRLEAVKEQERAALTATLDEQTREWTLKLLEMEMEAQDTLDQQEEGFKQGFEQERARLIQTYREKLDHELKIQTELINERLREEVISQGIELQRRWIREIKVHVEEERGGRLGKLDELSASLKRLERIALDNSAVLDENIRVHALWSAIRALTNRTTASSTRKPFREELRVLRHITAVREDPLVMSVLDSIENTDVPDIGVEPFADLTTWFTEEVAPKVAQVALVPDENAGVLSYLASSVLSTLRFQRHGLVPGNDALSVLSRATYYLNEKNLDSAARELNQLKGPAKVLLHDWLEAARRRLEVEQALVIAQTQATLAALLLI